MRLRGDNKNIIKWYIVAAHKVHNNTRGHKGVTLQKGKGSIIIKYIENKLNTKISTELELVGIDYGMVYVLWTNYFLKGQVYSHEKYISANIAIAQSC